MKHQYFGDINDYRKYGLLRILGEIGWKPSICWMLTPNDKRTDGVKVGYLSNPESWRCYDPVLFDLLAKEVLKKRSRNLSVIQGSSLFSSFDFWNCEVPQDVIKRRCWWRGALSHLSSAKLIFFDPDNGLEVTSQPMGRKSSPKYLYYEEVISAWAGGFSLLLYQHFPRQSHVGYANRRVSELRQKLPGAVVIPLKAGNVLFLLVSQPTHAALVARVLGKLRSRWLDEFREIG